MEGLIWVNENLHSSNFFNYLFKFITCLGNDGLIWIVIGVILLLFRKTRKTGVVMLCSLLVGFLINDFILKNIFNRARPFEVYPEFKDFIQSIGLKLPSGKSFPSGHSFSSFNCAMVITLMHKKHGKYSLILAGLIAFSRIFVLVHYPTDVLAGMLLGILTALCSVLIYLKICKSIKARKRRKILENNDYKATRS